MQLYQRSRELARHFPKKILCSHSKSGSYEVETSFRALSDALFIQYNSKERVSVLAVDIDTHTDAGTWFVHDLPEPSWTIWTDRGLQFAWVLAKPILAADRRTMRHAKDVLRKIAYALDADKDALGFNRIFRNPITNRSRFAPSRVNLRDFGHLPHPPKGWGERPAPQLDLFGDRAAPVVADFSTMGEGDGRNVALFDTLRFWAYETARSGAYSEFDLAHRAFVLNSQFKEPMGEKEVNATIGSIDRFIEHRYGQGGYMATTTPEERKKIAAMNGAKGGAITAKIRKAESRARLLAAINQMEAFEIKITARMLAERAGSSQDAARAYLRELGFKEVSRKEGWKR